MQNAVYKISLKVQQLCSPTEKCKFQIRFRMLRREKLLHWKFSGRTGQRRCG